MAWTERERLEKYVAWNKLTRHQIITAHLTLIEGDSEHREKLARAFDIEHHAGWSDLIQQVISKAGR